MKNQNSRTYNIVLGGIIAAMSIVIMLLTILLPIAEFVFPALAGILLVCTVFEVGEKWSYVIFAAVSILSMILLPDKSPALYYILFLGHYPITKSYLERIKSKPLKWTAKIIIFNILAVITALLLKFVFQIEIFSQIYMYLFMAIALNAAFIIYDIALNKIVFMYRIKWRKFIHKR